MDIDNISIQDLKQRRPDLYQAIKQEVCLGELGLTKEDILALIDPLAEKINECLKPYSLRLSRMTYNDIVDMENDIVDEVSAQLQNEFDVLEEIVGGKPKRKNKRVVAPAPIKEVAEPGPIIKDAYNLDLYIATLDDLKSHRPDLCDLLYAEFMNNRSKEKETTPKKVAKETGGVKKGDAIRWNYTKDEGIVVGVKSQDGISNIVVRLMDGTKTLFENDPKLFTILEGEERANALSKGEKSVAEKKERNKGPLAAKKPKKAKRFYEGVIYDEPTRKGSKLKVGDHIRFKLTKDVCVVKGFFRKGGLDRIHLGEKKRPAVVYHRQSRSLRDSCYSIAAPRES